MGEQHKHKPRAGSLQCYKLDNVKNSLVELEELERGLRSPGCNVDLSF